MTDAPLAADQNLNALRTSLHNYGLGNWVGKSTTTPNDMLRIAEACVQALDQFDRYETEVARLKSAWDTSFAQAMENGSRALQAEHERVVAVEELKTFSLAFEELGKHVFGGGWLDHASGCNGEHCNCGLREWLKAFEKPLGVALDVTPTTTEKS